MRAKETINTAGHAILFGHLKDLNMKFAGFVVAR
jgi:hypothetical protein